MEGKITSIERHKRDKTRASIFIEGGFACGVNDQTIEQFRLRKGDYLDNELSQKLLDFDEWVSAKRIGMRFADSKLRSIREIRDRLRKEEISDEVIDRTIEFLRGYNFIDEERFARAYIHDRLIRKSVSSGTLARELQHKGIADELIRGILAETHSDNSDLDRAREAAAKQWTKIQKREADSRKAGRKLFEWIIRRGFSVAIAKQVSAAQMSSIGVEGTVEEQE